MALDNDETLQNYIILVFDSFAPNPTNPYYRDNAIIFHIICNFDNWHLADGQLRPYRIAAEIDSMFNGAKLFSNPKPINLISDFLRIVSFNQRNDIILDFFSGSSSTAHAVMQLNAEDGGNRKFIMVQLPEECPEKSEARNAGYDNICEIGKERIRRAGDKIVKENKDKEGIENLDIGFKVIKIR